MTQSYNPFDYPEIWDVITIAGVASPGIAKVSGFKRKSDWDQKKGKGVLGATLTYTGRPAAEGSAELSLWLPIHFDQWEAFRPLLQYNPAKKTVTAVDLFHPGPASVGVSAVVTSSISEPEHQGKGLYTVTIDFIEYFPPPKAPAVGTPGTSKSGDSKNGNVVTDPVAAAQQAKIAELLAQAQKP